MKNNNRNEKDIKLIQKISKEYKNRGHALNLIDDYSKLINILDKNTNSASYQINIIDNFFKKHPNADIKKIKQL